MSIYNLYFSNFGRPLVPDDLSKDSAPRHPWFWRRRFLKVFTIYGHGGHLGQRAIAILTTIHSPNLRRLRMKFEQNWPRGSRGEVVWNSEHFSHPHRKKVKCQCTTIILATLVDLPFPMIYAKIQPQGILGFGEEDFPKQMHREANLTLP